MAVADARLERRALRVTVLHLRLDSAGVAPRRGDGTADHDVVRAVDSQALAEPAPTKQYSVSASMAMIQIGIGRPVFSSL